MFLNVGNDVLNKTTQETPQNETAQTIVEIRHNNPHKTTASTRVKLTSKQKTPAPTERQNSKPTPIVAYEEYEYIPPRVESEQTQGGTPSYNT